MRTITFLKPVIDLKATGNNIRLIRTKLGFSVKDIQNIFGFEYPQAVYLWEQGKNVPTIDNLLVLARLFKTTLDKIVVSHTVEIEISCSENSAEKLCSRNCEKCSCRLTA